MCTTPNAFTNQTNQIQFEKLGWNNKVGNYNPAKVGSFMLALTGSIIDLDGFWEGKALVPPLHMFFVSSVVKPQARVWFSRLRESAVGVLLL
jgi:hypothetical protein